MSYNAEHPNNIARKQDTDSRIQPLVVQSRTLEKYGPTDAWVIRETEAYL